MAKLKLDKETLQGFFFNHTEKIVLAVVLLLLALFIWSGTKLEHIGDKSPTGLVSQVDLAGQHVKKDSWDNIKVEFPVSLDHVERKEVGDAATSESYYRLNTPLIGPGPQSVTPRLDPELFAVTDIEATVVIGALAFKGRKDWPDPYADLENMEQKKIEAPKKKKKKKKKSNKGGGSSMYGSGMEGMYSPGADEAEDEGGSGESGAMYSPMGMAAGGGAAGPTVRADADKFYGYRPTATTTANGPSVMARAFPIVSVKALVPYQQQWDEFERVFADAKDYVPSRDIPRYLSFRAERAEVPSDPNAPLKWELNMTTSHALSMIPKLAFAGYPGEIADPKYLLPGILTMPVPPVMMRDLSGLALHSKVPMQEEVKTKTPDRAAPALADIDELNSAPDADALAQPGARPPGTGAPGANMYGSSGMPGAGGEDTYGGMGGEMYGSGGGGMYGSGGGGMGGVSAQLVRGPQSEFLMVRFFDLFAKPGKKYVYRVQVVMEDPNHPQNPLSQPQDRYLADTTRTRLASVAAEEAKQSKTLNTPVRIYTVASEWSAPTAPVSITLTPETYAGGVTLPRMLDILRNDPSGLQKTDYSVPADGEPAAEVMNLTWNSKYSIDFPGLVTASRGTHLSRSIEANVIDPITLTFKVVPDYPLSSGELIVDIRGGEVLETPQGGTQPLLTPGEVAFIDAAGNFKVRNELDNWKVFDKFAPPPPIVVEASSATPDGYGEMMGAGEFENPYGE